jgi:hypothetical protein
VLLDGVDCLLDSLTYLVKLIYEEKKVTKQWLVAKTILTFKNKGQTKDIENYRPIVNLCATFKIFEKLIPKHLLEIQEKEKVDLQKISNMALKGKKHINSIL